MHQKWEFGTSIKYKNQLDTVKVLGKYRPSISNNLLQLIMRSSKFLNFFRPSSISDNLSF